MVAETHAALEEMSQPGSAELLSDVRRLRQALHDAVRALGRRGVTPAAYAALSAGERTQDVWQEAVRVWRAAGIVGPRSHRVVLRYTEGCQEEEREYDSPEAALQAAVAAIEMNECYPVAIEVDGRSVMDRATILRAWEDRHDPG